ncbi:MAG TPA: DUF3147 family protein [Nitrospira sp.]
MWEDVPVRFLLGGVIVLLFSLLGDIVKPKTFAGLFSAAPSVALGTLGLALVKHGTLYTTLEAKSMMAGAVALLGYSYMVSWMIIHYKFHSLFVASTAIIVWFCVAFGIWFVFLT